MEDKILSYFGEIEKKKGTSIDRNEDLFETGILDSLEILEFLTSMQENYHIEFSTEDMEFSNFQTIDKIIKWANSKKEGKDEND